ncbi:hypothetical protein EXIGLDRAFT_770398 [Exidia glandulosa HHB12029]|uniref:BTB domain-containing protein n=1 Tax=Exidia glandulosa HHB12029 TaxID=1314781 RepID=A0A165GSC3_EXIGL|nr:hypothetical protein EXIGLDRAFT_770398 [Exidia glandulosa HHB12029]
MLLTADSETYPRVLIYDSDVGLAWIDTPTAPLSVFDRLSPQTPTSDLDSDDYGAWHISTLFQPSEFADTLLVSSDDVAFYVQAGTLTVLSQNGFAALLPATPATQPSFFPVVRVEQTAAVLDVVLHALYGLALMPNPPGLSTLSAAIDALLVQYAIHTAPVLGPATPLFDVLLAHAQLTPFEIYVLAAKHNLIELAIASSAYLLSFPLNALSEADAERIGPIYLRKLFFQHMGRICALQRLLLVLPAPHLAVPSCRVADVEALESAWMLAAAYLNLQARPDHTPESLQATLGPLLVKVWCKACRTALQTRIDALIAEWGTIKRTI